MEKDFPPALLVDTPEAARACGLSVSFLYKNWKGNPAAFRAGRALRWSVPTLQKWMSDQAQQTDTQER